MAFEFITKDPMLKLFSLAVALLLFLFVSVESATPVDVEFRIDYAYNADEMTLIGDAPTSIHATLQGPWANIRSFDSQSLDPVIVDIKGAGPGVIRHRIDVTDVRPPGGMRVVSIRPAEIEVNLDRRVNRQVDVQADIPERPAFGYEVQSVTIQPPKVRVEGPASKLDTLKYVSTRPIDVGGRQDDLDVETELRPPPPGLQLVDKKVRVLVDIADEMVQRTFQAVAVALDNAPRGTQASPEAVTVTVKGPRRIIDPLDQKAVQLYIDAMPEAQDGQLRFEKTVALRNPPERTILVSPVPKIVLQLPKKKTKRK